MDELLRNPSPTAPRPLHFSVLRVPFFLEPNYDESKPYEESNRDRLYKKWGGAEGWARQKKRHNMKGRGIDAGIPHFNLDRLAANSMASHRLVQHIGKRFGLSRSEALYDRLNVYYFVDGNSLNDKPLLAKVAAEQLRKDGIDIGEDEILVFLNSDEGREEIEMALDILHNQLGIHSIPQFIVEGSTIVGGAAGWEEFVDIFREIEDRGEVKRGPIFAGVLGVDDETLRQGSHVMARVA
eukprot:CAMPEP_0113303772 /NCGR_PEP_ID=MMETSP0010_2-20120614/4047_1 /TAXON_ID=216773 ORGANISM="Corethron hystrix, Strain 308" /NCGR_SAMPLE_ID=MMETSP0010_2 /ASSEMBLY_ACC=CAM_ASM_000155 /LENGTH=238 /DNA_ID=CAMNT_0000157821 /DNA_START=284 /DNA_END=1000 /DNA_ORIENTATION=+ /assembly_acc=CAM_ASM_000155